MCHIEFVYSIARFQMNTVLRLPAPVRVHQPRLTDMEQNTIMENGEFSPRFQIVSYTVK